MKFLYEKLAKESAKLVESHKKEIKELVSKKLESDYRFDNIVKEREQFLEKERILLNTFDLWKLKFDSSNKAEDASSKTPTSATQESDDYECDECVYEATTQSDLKEHKIVNHSIKCGDCGHTVLTENDLIGHKQAYHAKQNETDFKCDKCGERLSTEMELKGHKQSKHREQQEQESANNFQSVFMCNDCDDEFLLKSELEDHIQKEHGMVEDMSCDKCEYRGTSDIDLDNHRKNSHFILILYCGVCNFETTNSNVLKNHKRNKHSGSITETRKARVAPPPKCNPKSALHTTDCCNRVPGSKKSVIYTQEERRANGICLDWNKGNCENYELCSHLHIEIEACRFANNCSRLNCRFWHDTFGKFPFLEDTSLPNTRRNW